MAPNRDSFLGWFSPFPDRFWLFSISPGIHTPFSTAWYCDPAIKSLPLENLHFLTDVTTITTAISTAKYRAEFLCLRYYFMRTVGADEFVTICGVCAGLLLTSNSSFFFLFLGDFFFPTLFKNCFCNTEPYFLPLLKETQRFFRPSPQVQTSPRPLLNSDFLQIYLPTRFPSPGQKQRTKGKGAPGLSEVLPHSQQGHLGRENKTIEHR